MGGGVGCRLGALFKLDVAFRSGSIGTRKKKKPEHREQKKIPAGASEREYNISRSFGTRIQYQPELQNESQVLKKRNGDYLAMGAAGAGVGLGVV